MSDKAGGMIDKDRWGRRADELLYGDHSTIPLDKFGEHFTKKALQLGLEMADARAEEIAKACAAAGDITMDAGSAFPYGLRRAAEIARSTISEPKTREQRLEAALREIEKVSGLWQGPWEAPGKIARRALWELRGGE